MKFFMLYLLIFLSVFIHSFSSEKTEMKTRYRINEKGEREKIHIYYDSYNKPIKEVIHGKKNEIKYTFIFSDYTRYKKPLKAKILDLNEIVIGFLDFKYDEDKLLKIIKRDVDKKAEKISLIKKDDFNVLELSLSTGGELLYKRNYKMDEIIKVNKLNEEKVYREVSKNDKDYIYITEYDLYKRLKSEIIKEKKTGIELFKYEFQNYDFNNKPKKALIRKYAEDVIGYFEFEYSNNGILQKSVQYNLKGEMVNSSNFENIGKDYIKYIKNEFGDIINEVSYKMDDKIVIKEKIDNIFYEEGTRKELSNYMTEEEFFTEKLNKVDKETENKKIKVIKNLKEVVGKSKINLSRKNVKLKDTILAQLITDSLKLYAKSDIVLFPGGSIKRGVNKGNISNRDLYTMFDQDDKMYLLKIKGKDIIELLREERLLLRNSFEFLNTAGLTWELKNKEISNVMINGYDIDENKYYSVASNEYIANNEGIYSILTESKKVDTGFSIYKILSMYIKNLGEIDEDYLLEERRIIKY